MGSVPHCSLVCFVCSLPSFHLSLSFVSLLVLFLGFKVWGFPWFCYSLLVAVSCLSVFFLSLSRSLSLSLFLVLFLILPCGYRCYCTSLFPAVPQCSLCLADSLFVSLCLLPLSGFSSLSFCLASRPSPRFSFFSSLFASVTPSPCLLSLSLCVKGPAPLLFSSFLFLPSRPLSPCLSLWFSSSLSVSLASLFLPLSLSLSLSLSLAPSLPAVLSGSVPHCSLPSLCLSVSLSFSLFRSVRLCLLFASVFSASLSPSFSRPLFLSLSLSLCFSLSLVYSVCLWCWSLRLSVSVSV